MKLLIASDIHGCLIATQRLIAQFEQGGYDYLVLLGDLLNHGPRNPLPENYAPIAVTEQLNPYAQRIIAVRGNCDSEVDQALLHFPLLAEYNQLLVAGRRLFLCHGHTYSPDKLPPLSAGDIFCCGHFHIPQLEMQQEVLLLNPGSASMPREGHRPSFASLVDGQVSIIDLTSGERLQTHRL